MFMIELYLTSVQTKLFSQTKEQLGNLALYCPQPRGSTTGGHLVVAAEAPQYVGLGATEEAVIIKNES